MFRDPSARGLTDRCFARLDLEIKPACETEGRVTRRENKAEERLHSHRVHSGYETHARSPVSTFTIPAEIACICSARATSTLVSW